MAKLILTLPDKRYKSGVRTAVFEGTAWYIYSVIHKHYHGTPILVKEDDVITLGLAFNSPV